MSNWADKIIANQMGFSYCVLFPTAREALKLWTRLTAKPARLPTNVCAVARDWATSFTLHAIDESGLAPGVTTQLYGYREVGQRNSDLDLDPLGTGFFDYPCATSAIVSFGQKKFVTIGGAAFVTQDNELANAMQAGAPHFPPAFAASLEQLLDPANGFLLAKRESKRKTIYLWDRHLGDMLERIDREQIVPWRVMRKAMNMIHRGAIVHQLRAAGFDVGINYPSLADRNDFGYRVLNFFVTDDYDETKIKAACEIIRRIVT